jgi:hypothetical protein
MVLITVPKCRKSKRRSLVAPREGKIASVKDAKPKPKNAAAASLAGGFARISETRIRKIY